MGHPSQLRGAPRPEVRHSAPVTLGLLEAGVDFFGGAFAAAHCAVYVTHPSRRGLASRPVDTPERLADGSAYRGHDSGAHRGSIAAAAPPDLCEVIFCCPKRQSHSSKGLSYCKTVG